MKYLIHLTLNYAIPLFQNNDLTIAEKVTQSATSTLFTLYKEGLFYKCYNKNAMLFVKKVKEFKLSFRHIKASYSNVFNVGFPSTEIDKGKLSIEEITTKIESHGFELKNELVQFSTAAMPI